MLEAMSSLHYLGTMTYRLVVAGKTQPGAFSNKEAAIEAANVEIETGKPCRIEAHYPSPEIPKLEFRWNEDRKEWVRFASA